MPELYTIWVAGSEAGAGKICRRAAGGYGGDAAQLKGGRNGVFHKGLFCVPCPKQTEQRQTTIKQKAGRTARNFMLLSRLYVAHSRLVQIQFCRPFSSVCGHGRRTRFVFRRLKKHPEAAAPGGKILFLVYSLPDGERPILHSRLFGTRLGPRTDAMPCAFSTGRPNCFSSYLCRSRSFITWLIWTFLSAKE